MVLSCFQRKLRLAKKSEEHPGSGESNSKQEAAGSAGDVTREQEEDEFKLDLNVAAARKVCSLFLGTFSMAFSINITDYRCNLSPLSH